MRFRSKQLFIIDGIGALMSAFNLGVILTAFEHLFGMPSQVLYFLALLPCLFAAFDFYSYFSSKDNWRKFLKVIAIANFVYCLISLFEIILNYNVLTTLGIVYFVVEIIIVALLASYEFSVANAS